MNLGSLTMSMMESTAPALGSATPYTSIPTRNCTMAPAHMGQGSTVEYSTQSFSRQSPRNRAASRMASISAWAELSASISRRLWPRPMISPLCTTTAPMGTSPRP
ncbi:MAG: hypothetical protein VR69_07020 [Peptococcaceae bacterium BRH_c4b]|nr:MAG: hypothetical protein VR69_07020 [Peptococcaceae bacterium BRH_c4b]